MILSNFTITCPQVSRGRSLQGRNAPQDRPSPIRVYKLQCEVEKRKTKEIDLGAHLMRIIIRTRSEESPLFISSVSPSVHYTYISYIKLAVYFVVS